MVLTWAEELGLGLATGEKGAEVERRRPGSSGGHSRKVKSDQVSGRQPFWYGPPRSNSGRAES